MDKVLILFLVSVFLAGAFASNLKKRISYLELQFSQESVSTKMELFEIRELINSLNVSNDISGAYDPNTAPGGGHQHSADIIDIVQRLDEHDQRFSVVAKSLGAEKVASRGVIRVLEDLVETTEDTVREVDNSLRAVQDDTIEFKREMRAFKASVLDRLADIESRQETFEKSILFKFETMEGNMKTFVKEYTESLGPKRQCPQDWFVVEDVCFKLFQEKTSWNVASKRCKKVGGMLFVPNTETKLDTITESDVWVGVFDSAKDGSWVYVDSNKALDKSFWLSGQPNNIQGRQWCGELFDGKINDEFCNWKNKFACQINLSG